MISEYKGEGRPLIDRLGARNVNMFIGVVYLVLWWWGLSTFVLIPTFVNTAWPIAHSVAYAVAAATVHRQESVAAAPPVALSRPQSW